MNRKPTYLSKSKYMHGLQCPKLLWYEYNRKKDLPDFSPEVYEIMKQGQIVGGLAQQLFPGGIKVERDFNPNETNRRSIEALKKRKPLYEPGFAYKNGYALADILVPVGEDSWNLVEVKSSSSVKNEHYADVAFQKYVYSGAGLKINQCFLMCMNRDYVRHGKLELDKLFKKEDITAEVLELEPRIEQEVESMIQMIAGEEPKVLVGQHCGNCLLKDLCWDFLPDEDHVFVLRGNKKVAYDLMQRGVLKLKDIPQDFDLNEKHTIQVKSHLSKEPYVDRRALNHFFNQLKYPLYFLDFETIAPAVPIYDNTRPFEDVPFQFSLHVIKKEGAKPIHITYLAPGDKDPRPEILKRLKKSLEDQGSILAYYAEYEKRCIRQAVKAYPEFNEWFVSIKKRFVDLLPPFANLMYYHPKQNGSASIKNVLPALTGITYDGMEIKDGGIARFEYMRVTFDKVDKKDKKQVRDALEKYCELDTLAMVEILAALKALL